MRRRVARHNSRYFYRAHRRLAPAPANHVWSEKATISPMQPHRPITSLFTRPAHSDLCPSSHGCEASQRTRDTIGTRLCQRTTHLLQLYLVSHGTCPYLHMLLCSGLRPDHTGKAISPARQSACPPPTHGPNDGVVVREIANSTDDITCHGNQAGHVLLPFGICLLRAASLFTGRFYHFGSGLF